MACEIRFRPLHPGPLDRVSRTCPKHGPVECPAAEGVVVCCTDCKLTWDRTTAAIGAGTVDFGVVGASSAADLAKRAMAADATAAAANDTATCPECNRLDARLAAVYIGEWSTWDSVEGEEIVEEWVRHVEEVHGAAEQS